MSSELIAVVPLVLLGIALLVLAIWLVLRLNRKARIVNENATTKTDVLSDGAEPARRNQALIDAPLATVHSQGPISAAANTQDVAAAPLDTDAEAGPAISPAQPAPAPAAPADPAPATPASSADDLTRIKGVGPKLVAVLGELGVTTYAQIAGWSEADVQRIDAQLGRFQGRITRDRWIEQARLLANGDEAQFMEKYGRTGA